MYACVCTRILIHVSTAAITPTHRPGVEVAATVLEAVARNVESKEHATDLDAALVALGSLDVVPWSASQAPGVSAAVISLQVCLVWVWVWVSICMRTCICVCVLSLGVGVGVYLYACVHLCLCARLGCRCGCLSVYVRAFVFVCSAWVWVAICMRACICVCFGCF